VKQVLELESYLVEKLVKPLNLCHDNLTDSFQNLLQNRCHTTAKEIMTLEVFLATKKFEEFKLASESLMQADGSCKDNMLSYQKYRADATDIDSLKVMLHELVDQLPRLLGLSRRQVSPADVLSQQGWERL